MTTTEIRPALSTEAWQDAQAGRRVYLWAIEGITFEYKLGPVPESVIGVRLARDHKLEGRSCHALAALALHGQSFGFTQEDVKMLHDHADWVTEVLDGRELYGDLGDEEDVARWRNLADRIAALLPTDQG